MKYFITGATGFIGGRIARMLREDGHEVVALVRSPAKAKDLSALGIQLAEGDIVNKESLRAPMTGVDGVFHVAAWYKVGVKDTQAHHINVNGTRNVLEVMKALGIPKGVYTSTIGVFSDTHGVQVDENHFHSAEAGFISAYERTKWQAHYEVALPMIKAGLPLVIVQPGLVYGPGDTSSVRDNLIQYLTRKLPLMPQKSAFMWAHIDDIARGHILAMEKGRAGESYIIGGEEYTFVNAIKLAEEITGIPAPKLQAPPLMLKVLAALLTPVSALIRLPESYHPETFRTIAGVTYLGNNSKARRELGYNPRPLRDGLRETLEHEMKLLGMR